MKKIIFTMCLCWTLLSAYGQGSTCPPNIDFELGNFSNWQCMVGTTYTNGTKNVIDLTVSDPMMFRHELITAASAPQLDRYGKFPVLCPYGGGYTVKLGNDNAFSSVVHEGSLRSHVRNRTEVYILHDGLEIFVLGVGTV